MNQISFVFTLLTISFLGAPEARAQLKPKIAVPAFEDISGEQEKQLMDPKFTGRKIAEQFLVQFVNSGKFDVVEREQIKSTIKEQDFSTSGMVNAAQAAELGKISGADFIIIGTIETDFSSEHSVNNFFIHVEKTTVRMTVKVSAKLVNVTTSSIIAAEVGDGTAENETTATEFGGGGGQATLQSLFDKAGSQAAKKIIDKFIPRAVELFKPVKPKILVAAVDGQTLTLNGGTRAGLAPGVAITVYREGDPIIDPETGKVLKIRRTKIAEANITTVDETSAEATLINGNQEVTVTVQVKDMVELSVAPGAVPVPQPITATTKPASAPPGPPK